MEFPTAAVHISPAEHQQASSSNAQPVVVDPCAHLVHILMCYQVGGGDPEFVRKAIESLVKKLKDRREQLDSLIMAVTSGGKQPTSCVTIPRSLDGRLQVAGRKGLPHVVYARIWRWPNVNKTELIKLSMCTTPTDHPDLICINPFHYDRIVSSGLTSLANMASFRMDPLPHAPPSAPPVAGSSSSSSNHFPPQFIPPMGSAELAHGHGYGPASSLIMDHVNQQCIASSSAVGHQPPLATTHYPQMVPQQNCQLQQPFQQHQYNLELIQLPPIQTPPEHWCSINYFELDTQLGERFKVPWTEVIVDGGMDPAGARAGRFCLGALPNVHRSEASERTRLHIGKGVKIKCIGDGTVSVECLSQKGVFVRSYYMDFEIGLQYGSTAYKICPGTERKVFDLRWAYAEMCSQQESAQIAAVAQAYAVAGIAPQMAMPSPNERAVTGVDELRRICCTIALSFVKGWGPGYSRSSIKETPCWIEIQLHRPLQLLNELLQRAE